MAGITGQGTTFNLPNYHGQLFAVSPSDTPFLSAIGGLSGGESTPTVYFDWQSYDLRAPASRPRLEGADAPASELRTRVTSRNVVQIIHETVEVSYTKQATPNQFAANGTGPNPVQDEMSWQIAQTLKQVALDTEQSFLTGTYAYPNDNATARRTQGIIGAITTNLSDNGGVDRALTETIVLDAMQDAWTNGGLREDETRTLLTNATLKRSLTKLFITDKGYVEGTRNVGGVHVSTIETDFGKVNIMLDRWMPTDGLLIADLSVCKPRMLFIPGKGFLFAEPLAKTGSAESVQLYGEIGLEYGHESMHAYIADLLPAA